MGNIDWVVVLSVIVAVLLLRSMELVLVVIRLLWDKFTGKL